MRLRLHRLDAALLVMTLIWGSNFTIIKRALLELPELAFNGLRLIVASVIFLAVVRKSRIAPRDWVAIGALGVIGHFLYQLLFMGGVARTSVANTSLIFACTPVTVALMTAALGHERVHATRWLGAALSAVGVYVVVGPGWRVGTGSAAIGDVMVVCAMLCWAIYTVASKPLLARVSPITLTGYSMAIGTVLYLPIALPSLVRLDWRGVSAGSWIAIVYSSMLALVVAYVIWYTAVQKLGNTRTSVYSNVVPIVAMAVAALWLGEPLTLNKIVGAAAVIAGVGVTRLEPESSPAPLEA